MLTSMTGFGSISGKVDSVEYSIEIKSVNNRYLKISTRMPDGLHMLEPQIEGLLRSKIQRGSVTLAIRMKIDDENAASAVNFAAIESYMKQLRMLEVEANPMMRVDLATLLTLPGVCNPPALDELAEKTAEGLLGLIGRAIDVLIGMRQTEGNALAEDLLAQTAIISERLELIAGRTDEVLELYHERLKARVEELTASARIAINEDSLAREVALFAERSDIAEEVTRLRTHIVEFDKTVKAGGPVGRKLDFMAQEMLREANTIASKSSDADIARLVVDIKTAVDRIKEQAANVE